MSDEIRVGPTFERCAECGGTNTDGYDAVVHYATCSKAPKGKRAKMEPTRVDVNSLTEQQRKELGLETPIAEPESHDDDAAFFARVADQLDALGYAEDAARVRQLTPSTVQRMIDERSRLAGRLLDSQKPDRERIRAERTS